MKLLTNILATAFLMLSISVTVNADAKFTPSNNTKLAVEYTINGDIDKKFFKFSDEGTAKVGFYLNDPHHNVNVVYQEQVGKTALEQLSFSSLVDDETARLLMNKDPRIGGFTPFNLVIYRKKSNHQTVITHIMPKAALDILQISDENIRKTFIKMFKPLDAAIQSEFPNAKKSYTKVEGYAPQTMMNFEIPFKTSQDVDDFFDDFQDKFESAFEKKGYIIAGFYNMKYSLNTDPDVMPDYTEYVVWSLCHIPFSYTIFDGKNPMPQAAIFAPCSMYAYIRPDAKKIVIGMPTLTAWAYALHITDKDKLAKIKELDTEIPAIIHSLGGIDTDSQNPLTRK